MSRAGGEDGARAGHGPNSTQPGKRLIVKLPIDLRYDESSGYFALSKNESLGSSSAFLANSQLDTPKRRGRPPKNAPKPANAPQSKSKAADLPKPVATRSSKRKAAEVNGESANPGESETFQEELEVNQSPRKKSRSDSQAPTTRASNRIKGRQNSTSESVVANGASGSQEDHITNGHITPTKTVEKEFQSGPEIPVTRTSSRGKRQDHLASSNEPMASIEPHERLDLSEDSAPGVTTRAGARTRSISKKAAGGSAENLVHPTGQPVDATNGNGDFIQSEADASKPRGKGRWPNGALKGKAATAAAVAKPAASKKKGAPGKRKTSDDAVVQAVYDRQAHLRSSYKDLRKSIVRAEQALLERTLEELEASPDSHMNSPHYETVMKALDDRRTKVLAQGERRDQLERELLRKRFVADVVTEWSQQYQEVEKLKEKYEAKCKQVVLDLLKEAALEDDDDSSVADSDEAESALISAILENMKKVGTVDTPTPAEAESAILKKGKAVAVKGRKGPKKRSADEEPLGKRVAKRHAPAMLSATTQIAEDSEADKAQESESAPVVSTPSRQWNKYQFDEYGVFIPSEVKKGPQKEEPNNRGVVKPWFSFTNDEIGFRNYPDELKGKSKAPIPGGLLFLDQFRGVYNLSGGVDDYDQELVQRNGLHPQMGIPIPGARNPDKAVPPTDWDTITRNIPSPLVLYTEEHPEGESTSRSWDIVTTAREWHDLENHMDAGMSLKSALGQTGLATFDAIARDRDIQAESFDEMLHASEIIANEIANVCAGSSPVPEKILTKPVVDAAPQPSAPATSAPPPPITSTARLSLLADASEILLMENMRHSPAPARYIQQTGLQTFKPSPPTQRPQSQLPSISFINNPSPSHSGLPPLAPQMSRPYPGPVMMAPPPPPPRNLQMQYPPIQPHPPSNFYGASSPSTTRNTRPAPGLRSILPRAMPGEGPIGPPSQHLPQQIHYHQPPPHQPQHNPHEHQRYYDAGVQLPPYMGEQYQGYPPSHGQYPPYQPHQSPRR